MIESAKKYMVDNTQALEKMLADLQPVFKAVNTLKAELLGIDTDNLPAIKDMSTKLSAYHGTLCEAFWFIHQLKENKQLAYYYSKKFEIENKEPTPDEKGKLVKEKFVDGSTTQEARFYVAAERRVRDIINGYKESVLERMRTCRNLVNEKKDKEV